MGHDMDMGGELYSWISANNRSLYCILGENRWSQIWPFVVGVDLTFAAVAIGERKRVIL